MANLKDFGAKLWWNIKDKAPEILVGVGVVTIVAGVVLACKATLDIDKVKDEIKAEVDETVESAKNNMDRIDAAVEDGDKQMPDGTTYDETNAQKDKVTVYATTAGSMIRTGLKVAKVYAPSVGLIVTGLACVLFSHKILRDRNTALLTAYTALDSAFKAYRARVIAEGGKEMDAKFLYGTKTVMKEVEKVNEKTGEKETVIESEEEIEYPLGSPYARIYDFKHSKFYNIHDSNNDWNEASLRQEQNWANELLKRRGWLTLNEVYERLGLEPSDAGMLVGWHMKNPNGDHIVDFGIDLCYKDPRFKNLIEIGGFRRKIVLDFNVDGDISRFMKLKNPNDLDDDDLANICEMEERAKDPLPEDFARYDALEETYLAMQNK